MSIYAKYEAYQMMSTKPSVLIVEDSKSVTLLLTSYLGKLGYSDVHTCDNGYSAIKKFKKLVKEDAAPIVLLDYMLPDMDCRSVLTQMLDIQPSARIILETATEQHDEGVTDLIRLGIYQYLEKPIRFEVLKNVFETLEKEDLFFKKDSDRNNMIEDAEDEIKTKLIDRINFILNSTKQVSLNLIEQMIGFSDDAIKSYLKELENSGKILSLIHI